MNNNEKSSKQPKKGYTQAVAYLRTSSAANVGDTKDSDKRQRRVIAAYAKSAKFHIEDADWFYDPAVSGTDPIETRPGFMALLDRIEANGVRVLIVEDASRFARDLMTQELGLLTLINLGVRVLTSNGDDLTDTSDPMKIMMRQVAGAFVQLEKARLVAKLKTARDRKRQETGRCEGRHTYVEKDAKYGTNMVATARALQAEGLSLRDIAAKLEEQGFMTKMKKGKLTDGSRRLSASSVLYMLRQ